MSNMGRGFLVIFILLFAIMVLANLGTFFECIWELIKIVVPVGLIVLLAVGIGKATKR